MSNNLRQIAKDLRSFVKRCKDVHYSDSLLITFLVTGLLTTFAPSIIRADVAEDQQEVSAQAYDTITDLRQSFLRAKKENQKALRGANAELAQLLKEGDQVVKSPWASFQFGTGYTNNDWGTSYKGRGGKKLEYYSRTNDLTKYVFDASKHQYGATNLNLPRNQEPNTLAITPANIHEPYRPYTPERLDSLTLSTAPTFDPTIHTANTVGTTFPVANNFQQLNPLAKNNGFTNGTDSSASNYNHRYDTYTTNSSNAGTNDASGHTSSGTIESAGTVHNTRYWWWSSPQWNIGAISSISGGTFNIGTLTTVPTTSNYYNGWWYGGGYTNHWSDYDVNLVGATARGRFIGGQEVDGTFTGATTSAVGRPNVGDATPTSLAVDYVASLYLAANPNASWSTAHTWASANTRANWTPTTSPPWYNWVNYSYNAIPNGAAGTFGDTQTFAYATLPSTAVDASVLVTTGVSTSGNTFNVYTGHGQARNGMVITGGSVNSTGDKFYAYGAGTNGVVLTGGSITTDQSNFTASGSTSNGIYSSGGDVTTDRGIFTISGTSSNGIVMNGNKTVTSNGTVFRINSNNSNGINNLAGAKVVTGYGTGNTRTKFIIADSVDNSNGIYSKTKVEVDHSDFETGNGNYNNGIFADTGSNSIKADNSVFTINGNNSHGIFLKAGKSTTSLNEFHVKNSSSNNGIYAGSTAGAVQDTGSTFYVDAGGNGIFANQTGALSLTNTSFYVKGSGNGVIAFSTATPINITGGTWQANDNSNGLYLTAGTTAAAITGGHYIANGNGIGILVGDDTGTTGAATITNMDGTSFTVNTDSSSDGHGTGIFLRNGKITAKNINIASDANGNEILTTVNTNYANEFEIDKTSSIKGTGNNNVAFNLQNGSTADNTHVKIISKSGSAGPDITFADPSSAATDYNNNTVYKVNKFINQLSLVNGDKSTTTAIGTDNASTPAQTGVGRIYTKGNNNVIYEGLAYVKSGNLTLGDAQMVGSNNIMVNLRGPRASVQGSPTEAPVGAFGGEIRLQGSMGGEARKWTDDYSQNNVVVYAASGQNSKLGEGFISNMSGTLKNVDIKDFRVGLGSASKRGIMVYATNGTGVDVDTSATSKVAGIQAISDGVKATANGAALRGYDVANVTYADTSNESVIGFANGVFSNMTNYAVTGGGSIPKEQSTINFKQQVDMVAKKGVAYYAVDGGKIVAEKSTRAGGGQSVVAFANGYDKTGTISGSAGASTVQVKNITAADYVLLADYANRTAQERAKTYQNVGAYAIDGGKVVIQSDAVASETAYEIEANKIGSTTATALSTKSLVYGMGAYANGPTSLVDIQAGTTDGKGIHVVTGKDGGVYATNSGQVNFAGFLTNQNNITTNSNGDLQTANYSTRSSGYVVSTDTRKGIYNVAGGNDHTNTTPFYVSRTGTDVAANINFTGKTHIGMYDGILYTGNRYGYDAWTNNSNRPLSDYYKKSANDNTASWLAAKYRGMENVTAYISGNKTATSGVNVGLINQAEKEIEWKGTQAGGDGSGGFLKGIGTDYQGMKIANKSNNTTEYGKGGDQFSFYSTIINSKLKLTDSQDVVIEDVVTTQDNTYNASVVGSNGHNDPFNNIAMESNVVTIDGVKVQGDATYRDLGPSYAPNYQQRNVGLAMGNSLYRWDDLDATATLANWRKTKNSESGIINSGKVDIWGGSKTNAITGLLVNFGTLKNGNGTTSNKGVIRIDHGNALLGTNGSIIQNLKDSEITVTGKYAPPQKGTAITRSNETNPSGENYAIAGISNTGLTDREGRAYENSLEIRHDNAKIYVEGDQAVGIYGENRNAATSSKVTIDFLNNTAIGTNGIDVRNKNVSSPDAKGIGIALVNSVADYTSRANAGGVINLTGGGGILGSFAGNGTPGAPTGLTLNLGKNDIATGKNGIGIYAEAADINLNSDNFAVETQDNGVGLWGMDDTNVAIGANHTKKFLYNYKGANDKNGFAMAFGGKHSGNTTARNDLDIEFTNVGDTAVSLPNEASATGTTKGIAGILVNTNNAGDRVINKGNIKEDETKSKTHLKAYGAVVNKGTFENWGDITLQDSLLPNKASEVTSEDMKKVNVGILANDHSTNARYNTFIEHHGDIKIGDEANHKQNIGSWAIYGYNITTGAKADGTDSVFTINRNSYGIYSGDGNVDIKNTKIKVGNDKVLGHQQVQNAVDSAGNLYTISNRQTTYTHPDDLLSGLDNPRERDSAIGVYINNNRGLSDTARTINIAADMDIDRFSHGIVLAEKTGGAETTVNLGTSAADAPKIKLAYSTANNAGGHVKSVTPHTPEIWDKEPEEQGNSVYYYSADTNSKAKSYANVTMDGDYNTAYFTKGSVTNYGNIDLRSQYDLELRNSDPDHIPVGYGSVGIISENTTDPSINEGKIITGLSDTQNMMYSVGMGAGRNFYRVDPSTRERVYDRTEGQGYVINNGEIVVQEENGIGMLATGRGSKAINNGTIKLVGKNGVGMYIDREAIGENHGTITGDAENLKGVVAINGGYIKNYGTIKVEGTGSYGIVTDSSKFTLDANGNPIAYHTDTSSAEYRNGTTAGQANGHGGTDLYGGTETSIEEGTTGNPKTTGVGTTITRPNIVPLTSVTIDGVEQPIFNFNNDADVVGKQAENIIATSTIQTVATGATELQIPTWLPAKDEYGNPAWPRYNRPQMSEVTRIGMYVDTSGVRYTNPIDGIENLTRLGKVNLYFGPEITEYTNSKAIRIANNRREVSPGNFVVEENNILKPFNDALRRLPGGATINPLSSSLTWQVSANIDDNNQITELVMSKVPYHSFAFDGDKRLINFTNNLDNIYEIARPGSEEKMIFNKLNSIGNGEGHILAQAFDQMRGHIYGGIQQRTNATSNLLTDELAQLRSENNASKDSNKIKAFGRREEYKTDTAGLPDWHSNAGGFVYLHEDETVKLGDRSGWYAGVVNNYFTFKDLARSYENQAMLKTGIFKQTPLDEDGTFTFTIGGDAFFGKTNTKRRFWVVDKEFRAKSDYYTYGADINAKLEKEFRLTEGFSIVPNVGLDVQYGRFSTVREDGDMALKIKSDDYYSVKPKAGVDFRYAQPVFKKSNFTASVGLAYETELGRLNDVDNEAKIQGAWTDYYSIKGDKEDRKGNFKSDLKLGLDNGRLGFTVNTGYDTKGHNFRAGLGLRALF